jgi:hypothetical protein
MASRRWFGFAALLLAGCGNPPAPYLACMNASGQINASLKMCQSDNDCTIKPHRTDCCGTSLNVGISKGAAAKFDSCESEWSAHFGLCGCPPAATKTEDGRGDPSLGIDGGLPEVRCVAAPMGGNICMTYTP